ncbi:serine carboxypeptidase-like 45 [Cucumis melo var. makuwa]|uniref:Carboxypeptidase n=1 Tax=Cucumis melo var. makuwa TaxID=1194695 RepID=A0A5D3DPU4_CUCMM|nr:serine carboxypeptidase-like 45 [Cucumis melo var. makuwa]TYK25594.1 serine carboxypeptidase-like 45 [Cucumis melo var. makuwa]
MDEKLSVVSLVVIHVAILLFSSVLGVPLEDEIRSLPSQPSDSKANFKQFGGYVTVDEKQGRALFYYFVEAQTPQPTSKPLVLWLNGGPGCSSVGVGAFIEHGPFKINGEVLVKNEYKANMLYVESPAGVGFSYSSNKSFYFKIDDKITARDNMLFLQNWFDKFPEYKNADFYITGESYGGHYVPQLAQLILKSRTNIKLKGIAIGNPLLDIVNDFNARDKYMWSHGVVSDSIYKLLSSVCNTSRFYQEIFQGSISSECTVVISLLSQQLSPFIDDYNVIGDVCSLAAKSQPSILLHPLSSFITKSASQRHLLSHPQENVGVDRDICSQENVAKYLNRKDVQKALHAKLVGVHQWSVCNTNNTDWLYDLKNWLIPTIDVVGSLVKSQIRVLVYSGDQDTVIPFTGTRTLVNSLAKSLGLNITMSYKVWIVDNQAGGWSEAYGKFLTFASVRGASHLAPETQPKRTLALFKAFLDAV